ncbi:GNAT family N-acetyltransferase [Reyranella sp. CPCC 100927]|uniref:GNAT family N-acetyltransferase n=1 Tax=Reyranella sp. CPCC 100927 TaxID=2599616 RepID=UPI0011B8493A|nr:GNAT family N-acetyltransferase [Reyranella sp. CPCC 100927]TWT15495.1 GNAT family N-acetyltransferase [Reyranella sp. CPCC 100927]
MLDPIGEVRLLEHLAFNAWPALQTLVQDDWILRFADGYTKRANSVNALAAGRDTPLAVLERRIADAEALYQRRCTRCVFRLTPLMDSQVGTLLQARGWAAFDETVVMVADIAGGRPPTDVTVAAARNDTWSTGYMTFNGVPRDRQAIHDRMLEAIVPEAGFALSVDDAGEPAAFGLGVIERRHVGLFDIVSDPARRRAGHGQRLVEGLMSWGHANNTTRAYLQVVADNSRAIALYHKLGFREAYRYHYRAAPV